MLSSSVKRRVNGGRRPRVAPGNTPDQLLFWSNLDTSVQLQEKAHTEHKSTINADCEGLQNDLYRYLGQTEQRTVPSLVRPHE